MLWENDVLLTRYAEKLANDQLPQRAICMTPEQQAARDLAMGLCLLKVDLNPILAPLKSSSYQAIHAKVDELCRQGFLWIDQDTIGLTGHGIKHATHIMHSFLNEENRI